MKRIAVLFSGRGSNLAAIIERLHGRELEVAVCLTDNPCAGGIEIAAKAGIPCEIIDPGVYTTREAFDAAVVERLLRYRPELTVLAGFMRILGPQFTERIEAINLHPSLLPRHKGLHAIERSYADSFPVGGVTVHRVSAELDGGEILLQRQISKAGLTAEAYRQEIERLEKEVLIEAIGHRLHTIPEGAKMAETKEDLFQKIGIDIEEEKIQIDLGKTKAFFETLQNRLTEKAQHLQQNIAEGKVDLGEDVGIKIDNEHIDIDLAKTKQFIEDLGRRFEGLLGEIEKSVKQLSQERG